MAAGQGSCKNNSPRINDKWMVVACYGSKLVNQWSSRFTIMHDNPWINENVMAMIIVMHDNPWINGKAMVMSQLWPYGLQPELAYLKTTFAAELWGSLAALRRRIEAPGKTTRPLILGSGAIQEPAMRQGGTSNGPDEALVSNSRAVGDPLLGELLVGIKWIGWFE